MTDRTIDDDHHLIKGFADLLARAGASKHPRQPGQWTGVACDVWRQAGPEWSRLLEAALAWELSVERVARPDDEPAVRDRLQQMSQATDRVRQPRTDSGAAS